MSETLCSPCHLVTLSVEAPLLSARMASMHKRSMLSHLGWIYVALIALWLVLRAIFFDQIWWLALLNTFAIYLSLARVAQPPLRAHFVHRAHDRQRLVERHHIALGAARAQAAADLGGLVVV